MANRYTKEQYEAANNQSVLGYLQSIGHPLSEESGRYHRSKAYKTLVIDVHKDWFYWNDKGIKSQKAVELAKLLKIEQGYGEREALIESVVELAALEGVYGEDDYSQNYNNRQPSKNQTVAIQPLQAVNPYSELDKAAENVFNFFFYIPKEVKGLYCEDTIKETFANTLKDPVKSAELIETMKSDFKTTPYADKRKTLLDKVISYDSEAHKGSPIPPKAAKNNSQIIKYLRDERGIDAGIISKCIDEGVIYQTEGFANVAFISKDKDGNSKHIFLRGTKSHKDKATGKTKSFRMDVRRSDKAYPFTLRGRPDATQVFVFEAHIDALSHATLYKINGKEASLINSHRTSLHGVSLGGLKNFLKDNPNVKTIIPCFDDDEAGRNAAKKIKDEYTNKGYVVENHRLPKVGEDFNEMLLQCQEYGLASPKHTAQMSHPPPILPSHMGMDISG